MTTLRRRSVAAAAAAYALFLFCIALVVPPNPDFAFTVYIRFRGWAGHHFALGTQCISALVRILGQRRTFIHTK
jgi:hypothetical protein